MALTLIPSVSPLSGRCREAGLADARRPVEEASASFASPALLGQCGFPSPPATGRTTSACSRQDVRRDPTRRLRRAPAAASSSSLCSCRSA